MGKKKEHKDIVNTLAKINPDIEIVGTCNGVSKPVSCKCKICGFDHYITGEVWKSRPSDLLRGHGCPACSGQALFPGVNDLETKQYFLSQEWNYEKNGDLKPSMVTEYSGKSVWWVCRVCGHEWKTKVKDRSSGNGCPHCALAGRTSFPEQSIYFYFKQKTTAINRYTDLGKEIDVYLPELHIGIEYNGSHWHCDMSERDKNKVDFFFNKGIRIIVIKDGDHNLVTNDVITHKKDSLDWAIQQIFNIISLSSPDICTKRDSHDIYKQYLQTRIENSFAIKYPELAKQWDYKLNVDITPYMVTASTNKKFYKICPICGRSYICRIADWGKSKMCKECSYETKRGVNGSIAKPIYIIDSNNCIVNNDNIFTIKRASEVLQIGASTVSYYIKNGKPLLCGPFCGCTISHVVP